MNEDMKEVMAILKDIQENEQREMKYAKKQAKVASIISIVACILAIVVIGVVFTLLPKINALVVQATTTIESVDTILGDTKNVVTNLNTVTDDLSKVDMSSLLGDVSGLVESTESSLGDAMTKINAIDIEGLNTAIEDLGAIVEPMAKLFGKR